MKLVVADCWPWYSNKAMFVNDAFGDLNTYVTCFCLQSVVGFTESYEIFVCGSRFKWVPKCFPVTSFVCFLTRY